MVDMLSLTGEKIGGLVGFEPVLQDTSEHSSESEEAERAISDVCSEFQVTVRLLGKKDTVTKLKVSFSVQMYFLDFIKVSYIYIYIALMACWYELGITRVCRTLSERIQGICTVCE